MYIALTGKHAGELDLKLEEKKPDHVGEVWLMVPFTCGNPKETYIALNHPYTGILFVERPERGWEKDIPGTLKEMIEKNLDHIDSFGLNVKSSFTDTINKFHFVPVTRAFKESANALFSTLGKMKNYVKNMAATERPFFYGPYDFSYLSDFINFDYDGLDRKMGEPLSAKQLETYGRIKYRYLPEPDDSFEINEKALTAPIPKLDGKNFGDTLCFFPKEPAAKNSKAVEALTREQDKLLSLPRTKDVQKRLDEIHLEQTERLTIPFSRLTFGDLNFKDKVYDEMIFEFVITLDLPDHQRAQRKVLVDADMSFVDFEYLLNRLFRWRGFPYHLSSFLFADEDGEYEISEVLRHTEAEYPGDKKMWGADFGVEPFDFFQHAEKKDIRDYKLRDYFPDHKNAYYRYDYGDNWTHAVELTGICDKNKFDKPLPYLTRSSGVAPPEDAGGLGPFHEILNLREKNKDVSAYRKLVESWVDENKYFLRSPCDLSPLFKNGKRKK